MDAQKGNKRWMRGLKVFGVFVMFLERVFVGCSNRRLTLWGSLGDLFRNQVGHDVTVESLKHLD